MAAAGVLAVGTQDRLHPVGGDEAVVLGDGDDLAARLVEGHPPKLVGRGAGRHERADPRIARAAESGKPSPRCARTISASSSAAWSRSESSTARASGQGWVVAMTMERDFDDVTSQQPDR
jgi:hypothetical protein